jgi:hypothetical protein
MDGMMAAPPLSLSAPEGLGREADQGWRERRTAPGVPHPGIPLLRLLPQRRGDLCLLWQCCQ